MNEGETSEFASQQWDMPTLSDLLFLMLVMRAPDGVSVERVCSQIRIRDRGLSLSTGSAVARKMLGRGYLRCVPGGSQKQHRGRFAHTYFITPEGAKYAIHFSAAVLAVLEPALVALRNARPDGLGVRSTT